MFLKLRLLVVPILIGISLPLTAGEGSGRRPVRPLCPEDAPEGVRLPPQPGCGKPVSPPRAAADDGFRDLGGVKLRIGGRVDAEYGIGR